MVLVEALVHVVHGNAAVEHHVHRSLVRAAFESVSVALCHCAVDDGVLVGKAILEHDRHIVFESARLLEEHVIAVVGVVVCTAAIKVVTGSYGNLRCESVGIAISFVLVLESVAVEHVIIGCKVFHLHSGVAVFIELAVFYDIVVCVLRAVLDV